MADQEFRVRITAETKAATDKIDAVENKLDDLTKSQRNIVVNVDANALEKSTKATRDIASSLKQASIEAKNTGSTNLINPGSLASAATLASTFYGIRKDIRGLGSDLGKSLARTNVSEFLRTEKFLDRVLDNSRSRTKEIVEAYQNIREIPGAAQALTPVENFARAKAFESFGKNIADQTLKGAQQGLRQGVQETKNFLYGDLFNDIKLGTARTIDTLGRLGLAIQGIQLLVGPLAAAWSAAFDSIIGQNIRLEQTILSTQTTLASTGRLISNSTGKELVDPLQKIQALEGEVRGAIENIRVRSIDLAGVTSQQIIDIFGVVATSISQVNGNIKDAEDLAISFTAAMGTLGIPFYQARQEIGSILGGYITEDSLLAKRLQISNADIQKAKGSIDGVVGYLKKKLETAVAGQAISAKGFSGVMSNIQEVFEVMAQRIGQPLLGPLVSGLTGIYEFLKKIQGVVTEVGGYLSTVVSKTITRIVDIFLRSKLAQSIGSGIQALAQPYQDLARSVQLGLSDSGNLIERWVNGIEAVPKAFQGVVSALQALGNFLKLQIELISEPLTQLLDQSRDLAGGGLGIAQRVARIASIPFGNFVELSDTFSKGWDTITSTIQTAGAAIAKFGIALVRLKITEFTAQLRAAAKVFEVFGSVILGRLNLAIAFFDSLGTALGSDFAKFLVSLTAINKLINNTDFFGVKGVAIWAVQTRVIFQQLLGDIRLFSKGFRDANNVDNLIKNAQAASAKVFSAQVKSEDPVLRNAAQVEQLTRKLRELETEQTKAAQATSAVAAAEKYASSIKKIEDNLAAAKKTQEGFTQAQRAAAALKSFIGGGAELAQAKEAARQASVMASGAASAQALSSVIDTLAQKLGLTREQMKTLGGATQAATRSLQTFLTTSMLINIGFTAASLLISAGISAWQQYEESVKTARMEALRMAQVQQILSSGYGGIAKAAEGGDVAAQRKLQEAQEQANAAMQIQQEKKNKLLEKEAKLNDEIYGLRQLQKRDLQAGSSTAGFTELTRLEKERTANKREQEAIDKKIYQINLAQQRVQQETNLVKNYTILAERRRDLEDKIKTVREDYEKEINDKGFQSRMELLNIEQQRRREAADQEIKALRERFNLLRDNATPGNQKILSLVEQYQTALIEGATKEADLRTEYVQKEQQLRKAIEDYAFKMQRERVALEKQVGSYQKEVENWKNKQSDLRLRKELAIIRQQEKLKGIYFQPYNTEQQQGFVNASQTERLNSSDAYALLQLIPKASLGITGTEDIKTVMAQLRSYLDQLQKAGRPTDPISLANFLYPGVNGADLVGKLRAEAPGALNTGQFYIKQDPSTVAPPNLNIDWNGMQNRMSRFDDEVLSATRSLQALVRAGNASGIASTLKQFSNPSILTDIKSDYTQELAIATGAFQNSADAAKNLGNSLVGLEGEMRTLNIQYSNQIRGALLGAGLKGDALTKAQNNIYKTGKTDLAKSELLKAGVGKSVINEILKIFPQLGESYRGAKQNITSTYGDRQALTTQEQLKTITDSINSRQLESKSQVLQDAFERFNQAVKSGTSETYSLARAQTQARTEVSSYLTTELAKIKGQITLSDLTRIKSAGDNLEITLLRQIEIYDRFNRALQDYQARLSMASRIAETWASATKNLATDLLTGSVTVREAMDKFAETLNSELVSTFLDIAIAPIKEQMLAMARQLFGVNSAEEKARTELVAANAALTGSLTNLKTSTDTLNATAQALPTQIASAVAAGTSGAAVSSAGSSTGGLTWPEPPTQAEVDGKVPNANPQKEQGKLLKDLNKGFAAVTQSVIGVTMAFDGMKRLTEGGGTYETLMGLSSIFMGLGSVLSGIGSIGKKAGGGPVYSNTPYLVGEQGPELFVPGASGSIIPNGTTEALLASRNALGGKSQSAAAEVFGANRDALSTTASLTRERSIERFLTSEASSTEIKYSRVGSGDLPFVTETDMLQATRLAAQEGARMGQQRTLAALRNDPSARRRIGI